MNAASLKATKREGTGKQAAKTLRRKGQLPAIMYGGGHAPVALALDFREFDAFVRQHRGESAVIDLEIEGDGTRKALLRGVQRDFVHDRLIHVDFQQISLTDRITATVPLVLVGNAIGARPEYGGMLEQSLRELSIECLASDIPEHLEADVSNLHLHESLHIGDLSFPGIRMVMDKGVVVATVVGGISEKDIKTEAEEEAEPEIIGRRGKEEEEA
jgi:large subunit ribosomal protein L25